MFNTKVSTELSKHNVIKTSSITNNKTTLVNLNTNRSQLDNALENLQIEKRTSILYSLLSLFQRLKKYIMSFFTTSKTTNEDEYKKYINAINAIKKDIEKEFFGKFITTNEIDKDDKNRYEIHLLKEIDSSVIDTTIYCENSEAVKTATSFLRNTDISFIALIYEESDKKTEYRIDKRITKNELKGGDIKSISYYTLLWLKKAMNDIEKCRAEDRHELYKKLYPIMLILKHRRSMFDNRVLRILANKDTCFDIYIDEINRLSN